MNRSRANHVYIIGAAPGGPVKIGVTDNLPARLRALQTGCPQEIKVLHSHPVTARRDAMNIESRVHDELAQFRMSGEWFDVAVSTALASICGSLVEPRGAPDDQKGKLYLSRVEAAAFLKSRGLPCAATTLAKYATVGGGPRFSSFGRRVLYTKADLMDWVTHKLGKSRASTSSGKGMP